MNIYYINVTSRFMGISQRLNASSFDVLDCECIQNPLPLSVLSKEDDSRLKEENEVPSTLHLYQRMLRKLIFLQHRRLDLLLSMT
jgi:hypothetical protein